MSSRKIKLATKKKSFNVKSASMSVLKIVAEKSEF